MIYELLYGLGFLVYLPRALVRRRLPHAGWGMRLGHYPKRVAESLGGRRPVWIHAVSVGEVLATRPLLKALAELRPGTPIILSTITPAGFNVASQQPGVIPIYFPLDLRGPIRRALSRLNPFCVLLMESELWPMMLCEAEARNIPVAVVNGRLSQRAFARYQIVRPWVAAMLKRVALFLMQSQADADRLLTVGAPGDRVRVTGSLKWDASVAARLDPQTVAATAARLGIKKESLVIVGGSTHRGEEALILQAAGLLRASHPALRLILAPRHIERLDEVEALVRQAGWRPVRASRLQHEEEWTVAIIDAYGQLPLYYAMATAIVIGGSFIPHGGQNPLEATGLGKPVVFGPSMHNFETIAHQLLAHHAARQASDASELPGLLTELVEHPDEARMLGARAQTITEQFQGATRRSLDALAPLLRVDVSIL